MKQVLFVAYGGGHIRMVIPVAKALQASGLAKPVVLALTTAAPESRAAGLRTVQFKDFLTPADGPALEHGRQLVADLPAPVNDPQESAAYLGLSYQDLVDTVGPQQAAHDYQQRGRQAFLPVPTLTRILRRLAPDLLVTTNSPRAERAAVMAARTLGIPTVCMVDLFAIDEVQWIGAPDYADRVCVLNSSVRDHLVANGRPENHLVVTGNPAFDSTVSAQVRDAGIRLRVEQGWDNKDVVLWASQPEPLSHPSRPGRVGDPTLSSRIFTSLKAWVAQEGDRVLLVRAHPSEPDLPANSKTLVHLNGQVRFDGRKFDLHPLLHAVNTIVTMNSTVGLEAFLAGRPVIQVLGSLFDSAVPLAQFGMAQACDSPEALPGALARARQKTEGQSNPAVLADGSNTPSASERVLKVIKELLA